MFGFCDYINEIEKIKNFAFHPPKENEERYCLGNLIFALGRYYEIIDHDTSLIYYEKIDLLTLIENVLNDLKGLIGHWWNKDWYYEDIVALSGIKSIKNKI